MRIKFSPLFLGFFLFVACASPPPTTIAPRPSYPQKVLTLEVEDFQLTDTQVVSDSEAGNGKAVRLSAYSSLCSKEVSLSPGDYVALVRVKAPDAGHNALYLVLGQEKLWMAPHVYKQYAYCDQTFNFTVGRDGKSFIQILTFYYGKPAGDLGVMVDCVEIWAQQNFVMPTLN